MDIKEPILSALEHSQRYLSGALDGLTQEEFAWKPNAESNNIAFLLWHLTRAEDYLVNHVLQREKELHESEGWQEKMGTPFKAHGLTIEELQAWPVPKLEDLRGYADSVREKTLAFLNSVPVEKLSEAVRPERSPDTAAIRLSRIISEMTLHVGQICYLRGQQRGLDK